MNNNFIRSFVCFLDKWGCSICFLWGAFLLCAPHSLNIRLDVQFGVTCLVMSAAIRYFYLIVKDSITSHRGISKDKMLVLDLVGYIKICDRKEVDLYYGPLIRMVVNNDINICYDGQMDYSFFTSNNELFIAVYDSKENCLFINSGYKKMIDDNKTEG